MMSIESIMALADGVGEQARLEGREPLEIVSQDEIDDLSMCFPNIGSYCPDGWEEVGRLFCDKTGWRKPSEPALTQAQLQAQLQVGKAYAIVEEGQSQLSLGVFERIVCSRCGGNHSGHATDMDGEPVCEACVKKASSGLPAAAAPVDFEVDYDGGTLAMVEPLTDDARHWVNEHVVLEPHQWLGRRFSCEPRNLEDLVDGIRRDGFIVDRG